MAVLALVRGENDPRPLIGEGLWQGEIIDQPEGENGFGYDPHFYLPDQGLTAAALDPEEKNRISPVSYTHLDVYKGQGVSGRRGPGRQGSRAPTLSARSRFQIAPIRARSSASVAASA